MDTWSERQKNSQTDRQTDRQIGPEKVVFMFEKDTDKWTDRQYNQVADA
jgi:hypothetical protein